jgi:hypothetical protein
MAKIANIILVSVLCCVMMLPANPLLAGEYSTTHQMDKPSGAAMLIDGVLVRPFGMVATLIGSAVFVVTLPFSLLGDNVDDAAQSLVKDPAKMTFLRPLGEFE